MEQTVEDGGTITIPNVFLGNPDTSTYILHSAEIIGYQVSITDIDITSLAGNRYRLTGTLRPSVWLTYQIGISQTYSTVAYFGVPLDLVFRTNAPIDELSFLGYLNDSTLISPVLVNNTLTFTYTLSATVYGINFEHNSLPLVRGSVSGGLPVRCVHMLTMIRSCHVDMHINTVQYGYIQFNPVGDAPYEIQSITSTPGVAADVLSIDAMDNGIVEFQVALPVQITYESINGLVLTTDSFLYVVFAATGIPSVTDDMLVFMELALNVMNLPFMVNDGLIFITNAQIIGTLSLTHKGSIPVTIAPSVCCNDTECNCTIIPFRPTITNPDPARDSSDVTIMTNPLTKRDDA
ncbi:hypothetical protein LJC33_07650 [Eubacteriales bacterium OttesenSCG-928-N13]|nr:hypothetical protein [Eubacteriales bacterium OttesenSCG-928-N13]